MLALNLTRSGEDLDEAVRCRIDPEAAIARMREFAAAKAQGQRFAVGDLVTPSPGGDLRGHGEPFLVIDVFPRVAEIGHRMPDMRVLCVQDDSVMCVAVESFWFAPYRPAA